MNRYSNRTSLTAAGLLTAAAAFVSSAQAQCDVYRPGLPDFDQRREAGPGIPGLPSNGSKHCVPTSAADAIAYAANHGAPELMFGNIWNWASPAAYNVATDLINDLGTLMGTDDGGTSSAGYVNGMTAFINARAPGKFCVSSIGWANGFGPSPQRVHNIIAQGGFALIVRGTYAPEENNPSILHRIGGHVLLARNVYDACTPSPEIGMRDPNSSDSKTVNSPWGVYRENMNQFSATFRLSNGTTQPRNYWEWSNDYGQNRKVFDGIMTFIPMFALTGVVINGEEAGVNIVRPFSLAGPIENPRVDTLLLPPGSGSITSIELTPDLGTILVFIRTAASHGGGGGAGKVSMSDIHFSTREFHDGPEFLTPVVDTCTSPSGNIFACEAHQISTLAQFLDGSIRTVRSIESPDLILACAFDDDADELLIVSQNPGARPHVKVFDGTTGRAAPLREMPVPPGVVFEGRVGLCIDPADSSILCCSEGRNEIIRLRPNGNDGLLIAETIELPSGAAPSNPHVNDAGAILCTSNGAILELENIDLNHWRQNYGSSLSGFGFGQSFSLATSRDGISRTQQTGPNTQSIDDETLGSASDCTADFNDDGALNSQDFFDFIGAFFRGLPSADFNDNGVVNSQDFFDFVTTFFAGC